MERLLHYTWKHRLFPSEPLTTTSGERVEVLDPGLWNHNAGPDFFNAKLQIGQQMWVGNVEIHQRSSDWERHHHGGDRAYENVVLHVVGAADCEVTTPEGRQLPQLVLAVPVEVERNFQELMRQEAYPACYEIIPGIPQVKVHAWMSALTVERLEQKTERVKHWLSLTGGDWERTFFITLARALGFGVNSDTFEAWAATVNMSQVGKHRDQLEQVEAYFLGTAGLMERAIASGAEITAGNDEITAEIPSVRVELSPEDTIRQREWRFLSHKFGLELQPAFPWKYLRMRPQNFPHVRVLQLALLYHIGKVSISALINADSPEDIRRLFHESLPKLGTSTINLLLINVAAPVLFAYGQSHEREELIDRAFVLLESTPAEKNYITRCWELAGLRVKHAADSQALIQLRTKYCDRRDCLRCRFGAEYIMHSKRI